MSRKLAKQSARFERGLDELATMTRFDRRDVTQACCDMASGQFGVKPADALKKIRFYVRWGMRVNDAIRRARQDYRTGPGHRHF